MVSPIRVSADSNIVIVDPDDTVLKRRRRRQVTDLVVAGVLTCTLWTFFIIGESSRRALDGMGWALAAVIMLVPPLVFAQALFRLLRRRTDRPLPMLVLSPDGLELAWLGAASMLIPWSDIEQAVVHDFSRRTVRRFMTRRWHQQYVDTVLILHPGWFNLLARVIPQRARRQAKDGKYCILALRAACCFPNSIGTYGPLQLEPHDLTQLFRPYIPLTNMPTDYMPSHPVLQSLAQRQAAKPPATPVNLSLH